jgi:hypothetical protein
MVLAGGLAWAGTPNGYPAGRPRLLSGSAWLASSQAGQLTLLDGSSAEVAAQVQVAPRGNHLDVVQQGGSAYSVNQSAGSIRRVDGATFDITPPATPVPDARAGLLAFAGDNALYTVDTGRGVLAVTDPLTLANRGTLVSVATRVAPQAAAIDDTGRLWLLDQSSGDLIWITDGRRHTRRAAAAPGAGLLTLAGGAPVLVDAQARTATTLDPDTGAARHSVALDLRAGERIQVAGSAHSARVYLVASRGVLAACDLTAALCDTAVPLGSGTADLGVPVETGGRIFVPDFTTGRVWIVDLKQQRVVAQPQVIDKPTRFQLLSRDGIVFFNDPDSEHAGVVRLDGGVRRVAKYDPADPDKGLTGRSPGTGPSRPAVEPTPTTPPTVEPLPGRTPPNRTPTRPPPRPTPTQTRTTPPPARLSVQIVLSKPAAVVGEDITVKAVVTGGHAQVRWTFGDGQAADGPIVTHHWAAPQTYQISASATADDGRRASASVPIQVSAAAPTTATLSVHVSAGGTVSSQPAGIACPPTCSAAFGLGQQVTLTAAAKQYFTFSGWGGACGGAGATCAVTVDADRSATAGFADGAEPEDCVSHDPAQLTINQSGPNSFQLIDRGNHLMATLATNEQAQNALSVARGYTQHCFVGRGTRYIMQYWKGGAGQAGPVSPEDCVSYDPNNLSIVAVNDASGAWWSLRDGGHLLEAFTSESRAIRGLRVAQRYTSHCYIVRPNADIEYWR